MEQINIESNIEIAYVCKEKFKPSEIEREIETEAHITFTMPDGFTTVDPDNEGNSNESTSLFIVIKRINGVCPHDCKIIRVEKTGRVGAYDWIDCVDVSL